MMEHHLAILKKGKTRCENCNIKLYPSVISIAHILPKRRHAEVMDKLENYLYLCGSCHGKYDRIQANRRPRNARI